MAAGAAATTAAFALALGVRPDFWQAIATIRFPFKVLVVAMLAVTAFGLVLRVGRPGAKVSAWGYAVLAAPALLAIGAVAELFAIPAARWSEALVGTNRVLCLIIIPSLSLLPLAAALFGLRHGAPTRPALAGAVAGLLAGAMAAVLYALNCDNDSPLFVMTWYPLAISIVVLAGSLLGARLLRW